MKRMRILSASSSSGSFAAPENDTENDGIKKEIKKLQESNKQIINLLGRLTEEVLSLKQELKRRRVGKIDSAKQVLPDAPINNLEELTAFEENLRQLNVIQDLIREFTNLCGTPQDFVRKCWHNVLSDDAAQNFTWLGTSTKKAAKNLTTAAAIRSAFQQKFASSSIEVFEVRSKKFFQYARDRMVKKEKYKANKNN